MNGNGIDVENGIMTLKRFMLDSEYTVFLTGAGMSTDSGIPDFRGDHGIYTDAGEDSPEYLISRDCLILEPRKFFDNYRRKLLYPDAEPNKAHYALAELERMGLVQALVTQNIDCLHEKAGSRNVIKLHGTTARNYCVRCKMEFPADYIGKCDGIPRCSCGGVVRPDVVLYGEGGSAHVFDSAYDAAEQAKLMVVAGSSLAVNTAASVVSAFGGRKLVIINRTPTAFDAEADLVIRGELSVILPALCHIE